MRLGIFEPVEGTEVGSDMVVFMNSAHNSGEAVLYELETG